MAIVGIPAAGYAATVSLFLPSSPDFLHQGISSRSLRDAQGSRQLFEFETMLTQDQQVSCSTPKKTATSALNSTASRALAAIKIARNVATAGILSLNPSSVRPATWGLNSMASLGLAALGIASVCRSVETGELKGMKR